MKCFLCDGEGINPRDGQLCPECDGVGYEFKYPRDSDGPSQAVADRTADCKPMPTPAATRIFGVVLDAVDIGDVCEITIYGGCATIRKVDP